MKRNPTLEEKKQLAGIGIKHEDWLVCKHNAAGISLKHKHTGQRKEIPASLIESHSRRKRK